MTVTRGLVLGIAAIALATAACRPASTQQASPTVASPSPQASALSAALVNPKARLVVLRGATIMTGTDVVIDGGVIVMDGGRLIAVGDATTVSPPGAHEIDVSGSVITPGLIDAHSHLGVYASPGSTGYDDGNEATRPSSPEVRAKSSYWPQDPNISRAVRGGVTTALILPGSANLIGGEGFTVVMKEGRTASEVAFPGAPRTLKMACGENPKRTYGEKGGPSTRMGELASFRQLFIDAKRYREKVDEEDDEGKPRRTDGAMETLADLIDGDVLLQVHCYKASDMAEMIEVTEQAGIAIRAFHHGLEAYKIRDLLAAKGIAVATWADWWSFKLEALDGIVQNAPLIHVAGGRAVIHSDSEELIQRLNQEAGKAMFAAQRDGLDVDDTDALKWITANPAWMLGIDAVTGTLEVGKRADVVVWNRHPFSVYAKAKLVFIAGEVAYDAAVGLRPSDYEAGRTPATLEQP